MKTIHALLIASALLSFSAVATSQSMRPYKDGPVIEVTSVRTKPGRFDDYMRHLAGPYKTNMEANIKAGLILGYRVFAVTPRTPHDPDVFLSITYPNMAALDKSEEFDAVAVKAAGPLAAQDKAFADRGAMREVLGTTLMRELILK